MGGGLSFESNGRRIAISDEGDAASATIDGAPSSRLPYSPSTTVGHICRFINRQIEATFGYEAPPPQGGKEFEEALLQEARRLEGKGVLTMSRYGTMVTLIKGEWVPVPSLPDFEGVSAGGRQFIIEVKVCSHSAFRMVKHKIKHRQVAHLLKRASFGARAMLAIHFNERLGQTFHDPSLTVAVDVKPAALGGWPVFEAYAQAKDKSAEMDSITRELALSIGRRIPWSTPPGCRTLRPDLREMVAGEEVGS